MALAVCRERMCCERVCERAVCCERASCCKRAMCRERGVCGCVSPACAFLLWRRRHLCLCVAEDGEAPATSARPPCAGEGALGTRAASPSRERRSGGVRCGLLLGRPPTPEPPWGGWVTGRWPKGRVVVPGEAAWWLGWPFGGLGGRLVVLPPAGRVENAKKTTAGAPGQAGQKQADYPPVATWSARRCSDARAHIPRRSRRQFVRGVI